MRLKSVRIAALAGILGFACLVPLSADQGSERRPVAGGGSRVMPFRLYANAIWVNVRVGNSRPLAFQLDTACGASVLNRSTADEIGLQFIGEASQANAGSGDNETRIALYPGVSLRLDVDTLDLPRTLAVPLDEVAKAFGTPLDGLIGYELMARNVVQIDYDSETVSVFDPQTFEYEGPGTAVSLELNGHEPIVHIRIGLPGKEPIEAAVLLDAPYPRSMTFGTPFALQQDLHDSMLKVTHRLLPSAVFGVGGKTVLETGRVEWVELGSYRLNLPDAAFASHARGGAFARTDIAGIIGGELLRRFRVILDYSRHRMILEPGRHFADPFETDASGLLIMTTDKEHRDFQVMEVADQTPGAEAGIRQGDRILSFDGKPASLLTLWQLRTLLKKAPRDYTLTIQRGNETKQIHLATRRLT